MPWIALILITFPSIAAAWSFSPHPICTLSHQAKGAAVAITYDPAIPEYRMVLRLEDGDWAQSASFGVAFQGPRPLTIGTDRHRIAGSDLSVADRGFGNVLYGLEHNAIATAFTTRQSVDLPLAGAADDVRAFRDCALAGPATS